MTNEIFQKWLNLVKMEKSGHLSPFLTVLGRVFGALRYFRPFWPKFKNRKFPKWLFLAIFAVSANFWPFWQNRIFCRSQFLAIYWLFSSFHPNFGTFWPKFKIKNCKNGYFWQFLAIFVVKRYFGPLLAK